MKKAILNKYRFDKARTFSVFILCFYYYFSLLRGSFIESFINLPLLLSFVLFTFFFMVGVLLILNFNIIHSFYSRSRGAFLLLFLGVLLFTLITQQSWLLIPLLLLLLYSDGDYTKLSKNMFVFSSIMFIFIVILGLIYPDIGREVRDKSYSLASIFGNNALSLGFPNSNQPLLYFTVLSINGAFLISNQKERKKYSLMMLVFATIIFVFTLSLTGYICSVLFLMLFSLKNEKTFYIIRKYIFFILLLTFIATPIIAVRYGEINGNSTNNVLASRPYLWNLRVKDGAYNNFIGNSDRYFNKNQEIQGGYTLDNQYLLLISRYGWLTLIIFLYVYYLRIQRVFNPAIIAGLAALSVYFLFESIMFILVISIVPILMMDAKTRASNAIEMVK